MYHLKIEIDLEQFKGKSLNRDIRTHYKKRNKTNNEIYDLVYFKVRNSLPIRPLTNYTLKICRYSSKALDYDGFVGALKPFVDGLTRAGVIMDDKWLYSGPWKVNQQYQHKKFGQKLLIEVIESKEVKIWKS
ncbi:hypothetical protein HBN50_07870 [Halobacteriovorax sp. GB3]|uniref:hypothetical protein n=1 Tax=Halobacteriovorax sp. GB3 TaxID=2719615 RepID=UPI00235EA06C|nr:hypothetical protein [Halobacteriovorax sp. GB3]MDD0853009.1 hypothetical protein [Halobacteriovorax sp. GB3]